MCEEKLNMAMNVETFYGLGVALIFVGMIVILVAIVLLFLQSVKGEGKVRGGGAIIIGPFPIIFGTDKESIKTVLWLALSLTILLIVMMVVSYLVLR